MNDRIRHVYVNHPRNFSNHNYFDLVVFNVFVKNQDIYVNEISELLFGSTPFSIILILGEFFFLGMKVLHRI